MTQKPVQHLSSIQRVCDLNGFPGGSEGKESASNAGDTDSIPGFGRSPGEGHGNTLQYSCLENPMDKRSLAGYSPQGRKELDMPEVTEHACTYMWAQNIVINTLVGGEHLRYLILVYLWRNVV